MTGRDLRRVELYDPAVGFTRVADAPAPFGPRFAAPLRDGRVTSEAVGTPSTGGRRDRPLLHFTTLRTTRGPRPRPYRTHLLPILEPGSPLSTAAS